MLRVETAPTDPPRAITTPSAIRRLGEDAAQTRNVEALIVEATAWAERASPGRWIYQEFLERVRLANDGERMLYLSARPVVSIGSVSFSGDAPLVIDEDFEIWPRGLYNEDGWAAGGRGWDVRYFGGFWLPASMGDSIPAGAESIDVEGAHLSRATWQIVQAEWPRDHRNPVAEPCSDSDGKKSGASAVLQIPGSTLAVLASEGAPPI